MRKLLLAGAALGSALACVPASAWAQSAVFPETSRAGKLDGAAPGSVQVSIGGRFFGGIEFQGGTGAGGHNGRTNPQFVNYVRLYPSFDYVNPTGIHFGASMEIRTNGARQAVGSGNNTLFAFSGVGYMQSDKFGKIALGTPNDALDQLGVGTGDDFGTGGFYGEYGWANAPIFAMADAYDGNVPKQKIAYYSPAFSGFTLGLSWQPNSVGLNNSGALLNNGATGFNDNAIGAQSRDRLEAALQYSHAFGPIALKADVGYAHAGVSRSAAAADLGYRDVSMLNAGAVLNFAGFEVEGSVNTGKWAFNDNDSGSPMGPSLSGAKDTTAYIVGVGYVIGPYSIGAQWYHVTFDQGDFGATRGSAAGPLNVGRSGRVSGVAVGGSYKVGPGVSVNFDFATNTIRTPGGLQTAADGTLHESTHGTLFALGSYFEW